MKFIRLYLLILIRRMCRLPDRTGLASGLDAGNIKAASSPS
jgi:hypothetical protein